jgi:hypothetical protein
VSGLGGAGISNSSAKATHSVDAASAHCARRGRPKHLAGASNRALIALLFCSLFIVYNSNLHLVFSGDSAGTRVLPLSIWLHHDLYLDPFVSSYLTVAAPAGSTKPDYSHAIAFRRGHWVSIYPVVTPILISPLYAPAAWYFQHARVPLGSRKALRIIVAMEKLTASLIAALSAVFVFLCLIRLTSNRMLALGLTLLYALASNTWVISSQALWEHGMSELMIGAGIWMLLLAERRPAYLFGAGTALALATANRPPNAILAAAILAYVFFHQRRHWTWFLPGPAIVATLLLTYNFYYFDSLAGGYVGQGWTTPMLRGLAGLLVSPSHGLLIYTPWTIFAFAGTAIAFTSRPERALYKWLGLAVIGELLLYAKWWCWWGGWCFGPRMLTDLMPLMTILLIPVLAKLRRMRALRITFVTVAAFSLCVQIVGAYFYFEQDIEPNQLWSWRNSQLLRAVEDHKLEFWSPGHLLSDPSSGGPRASGWIGYSGRPEIPLHTEIPVRPVEIAGVTSASSVSLVSETRRPIKTKWAKRS